MPGLSLKTQLKYAIFGALLVATGLIAPACSLDADLTFLGTYQQAGGEQTTAVAAASDAGFGGNLGTLSGGSSGETAGATLIDIDAAIPTEPPAEYVLTALIRDFKAHDSEDAETNPDFENIGNFEQYTCAESSCRGRFDDRDIVSDTLADDGKPSYLNEGARTRTTHGKAFFDQWFRTIDGTNILISYQLTLMRTKEGAYEYDSARSGVPHSAENSTRMFFPIDGQGFGNQGRPHNYSFTVELHTHFTYHGGEFFRFSGDDDLFVYIDKRLVINLGGIHSPEAAEVELDSLGLVRGNDYPLDLFAAERHETGSNIAFTTTLYLQPVTPR